MAATATTAAQAQRGQKTKTKTKKASSSKVGAPSQRAQPSRKGKRAWRKNVDIDDVEQGLEVIRTEERIIGSAVQKKSDDDLFVVDVTGDDTIRHTLPKFSPSSLTSAKILAQRSAVPAVLSRAAVPAKRKRLTHEEKDRLLRIGKRMRRGPLNAVVDPTEAGAGSALLELSEAARQSGRYGLWDGAAAEVAAQDEEKAHDAGEEKAAAPRKPKAPATLHPRTQIRLSAVPAPHEGTSYNPPLAAHQDLLRSAVEKEERRAKEAAELVRAKAAMEQARKAAAAAEAETGAEGVPAGMVVQEPDEDEDEGEGEGEEGAGQDVLPPKRAPERKTKQQRKKAERLRAERRALAEKLAQKRLLASVHAAKTLRKTAARAAAARERVRQEKHERAVQERLSKGLAGVRLGRHVVPEGEVDVQLSEDLTESLRGLKPEGNLFKDRFLSMQHRALIEPRVPVIPKRKTKMKEYEKHAWKRFDREQGVHKS